MSTSQDKEADMSPVTPSSSVKSSLFNRSPSVASIKEDRWPELLLSRPDRSYFYTTKSSESQLKIFKCKLWLSDTQSCRFCKEVEQIPLHLLGESGALMQKRSIHLGMQLNRPDKLKDIT